MTVRIGLNNNINNSIMASVTNNNDSVVDSNCNLTPVGAEDASRNISQTDLLNTYRKAATGKIFSPVSNNLSKADLKEDDLLFNDDDVSIPGGWSRSNSFRIDDIDNDGNDGNDSVNNILSHANDVSKSRRALQELKNILIINNTHDLKNNGNKEILSRRGSENDARPEINTASNSKLQLKPNIHDIAATQQEHKQTPSKQTPSLHSILKNSPRRLQVSNSTLKSHPELSSAIENGSMNPTKGAKVLFSPKKTVYRPRNSYAKDYNTSTSNQKSRYFAYSSDITNESEADAKRPESNNSNNNTKRSPFKDGDDSSSSEILNNAAYNDSDDDDDGSDDDDDNKTSHNDNSIRKNDLLDGKENLALIPISKEYRRSPRKNLVKKNNNTNDKSVDYDGLPMYKRVFVDPQVPFVISLYMQLFVNVMLISIILYFISMFLLTIRTDINNKINSQLMEITQEISLCAREYERNHCSPDLRVPALEISCMTWEKCMNRDPKVVGRAKIGAETFAEIINGFIKPISWKSMIFLTIGIVGSIIMNNFVFGTYRHYNASLAHQFSHELQHPQQQYITETSDAHQSPSKSFQRLLIGNGNSANNNNNENNNNNTSHMTPVAASSFIDSLWTGDNSHANNNNHNNNSNLNSDNNNNNENNENTPIFGTPFTSSRLNGFASSSPLRLHQPQLWGSPSLEVALRHQHRQRDPRT